MDGKVGRVRGRPACPGRWRVGLLGRAFEENATLRPVQRQWWSALPLPGQGKGSAPWVVFQVEKELQAQRGEAPPGGSQSASLTSSRDSRQAPDLPGPQFSLPGNGRITGFPCRLSEALFGRDQIPILIKHPPHPVLGNGAAGAGWGAVNKTL